jgi:superoxide dismutase
MAGGTPILALDMYEHTPTTSTTVRPPRNTSTAFMDNINWANVVRLHEAHAR